jgi:hypothetical protein
LSDSFEKKLKGMYEEFKAASSKSKDGEFSREDKLALMKDVFSQEIGTEGEFASS